MGISPSTSTCMSTNGGLWVMYLRIFCRQKFVGKYSKSQPNWKTGGLFLVNSLKVDVFSYLYSPLVNFKRD